MTNPTVKEHAYRVTLRVMAGLQEHVGISPNVHYLPKGRNSPRVICLALAGIHPSYLDKIRASREKLSMWAQLSDQDKLRVSFQGTNISIEIPKPKRFWTQVTVESLTHQHAIRRGLVATLGSGLQGEPLRIDFRQGDVAHVLLAGQTRSGKTNAQRLIAWMIAANNSPDEAKMVVVDVAKRGMRWADFNEIPHMAHPVITDLALAENLLTWLLKEADERARRRVSSPRLFVFIDELAALLEDSNVAGPALTRLAATSGEVGIHLILATQHPHVKLLGSSDLKYNLNVRLVGRVGDASMSSNAVGLPAAGAESLLGYGDMLIRDGGGVRRLTMAKLEDRHVAMLQYRNGHGGNGVLPLADISPAETEDGDGAESLKPVGPEVAGKLLANWTDRNIMGLDKIKRLSGGNETFNRRKQEYMVGLIRQLQEDMPLGSMIDPHALSLDQHPNQSNG